MLNKRILYINVNLICFLFFISNVYAEKIKNYTYTEIFNPVKIVSINLNEKLIMVGDVGEKIIFCNDNDLYICFYNEYISFAVPRDDFEIKKKWKFRGVKYYNLGIKKINFLDTHIDTYNIVTRISKIRFNFLYSKTLGLVAIGISDLHLEHTRTYLLNDKLGFK